MPSTPTTLPPYKVDDYATNVIADRLSTEPGVGQVFVFGSMPYAARVQINPAALAAKGLGLEDVRNALVAATVNRPKGEIQTEQQAIALDTNDQLFDAAQYGNIIIAYKNGAPVHIKDVGDVINSVQNERLRSWFGDQRAEGIAIQKAPGANTIAVVDRIKALMPKLEQSLPPSVHVDLMSDRSQTTRAAIQRRAIHDDADDQPRHRRDLPVSANVVGDHHPKPGGAAVAARHLWRHVCRRLSASTTSR